MIVEGILTLQPSLLDKSTELNQEDILECISRF